MRPLHTHTDTQHAYLPIQQTLIQWGWQLKHGLHMEAAAVELLCLSPFFYAESSHRLLAWAITISTPRNGDPGPHVVLSSLISSAQCTSLGVPVFTGPPREDERRCSKQHLPQCHIRSGHFSKKYNKWTLLITIWILLVLLKFLVLFLCWALLVDRGDRPW